MNGLPPGFVLEEPQGNNLPPGFVLEGQQPQQQSAPWYQQLGQAADDTARIIANAATFGQADRLAGWMSGNGMQAEQQATQAARDRAGYAGTAAEVLGAVATPMAAARQGATLMGRFGTQAMTGAGGLAARTGLAAAEGAAYGATDAALNGGNIGQGALTGAAFGTAGNVVGEGVQSLVNSRAARNLAPSLDEINRLKENAYARAESAGVTYTPQAGARLQSDLVEALSDMGYDPALQPGAAAVLSRINEIQGQNVTLKGMDTIRKVAQNGYKPGEKSNNAAVAKIVDAIDDVITSPRAGDVLSGNGQAGAEAIKEAREYARRAFKADRLQRLAEDALDRGAQYSVSGPENAVRTEFRQLSKAITSGRERGWSDAEKAVIRNLSRGTVTQNAARTVGKLAPKGVVSFGLGQGVPFMIGNAVGGPGMGAAAAAGSALAGYAGGAVSRNIQRGNEALLDLLVRSGGQIPQVNNREMQEAIARALIGAGTVGQ